MANADTVAVEIFDSAVGQTREIEIEVVASDR